MLTELLGISEEWYSLALALEIPLNEINTIQCNHHGDIRMCVTKMVEKWLQLHPRELSWNTLCRALKERLVSRNDVATKIEQKYL